ncbi:ABC transporter permease [Maribellus sp. YY47]|uniref:ABC transporter permease n=1 Tax=Maribellus sp. YY47 TaxID=2929486 RepID=UPI002001C1F9|nr:ABC transporter permease [Maribellus sp. YY47]MCK3682909.1 ABC transporter permease [Maribellus sp. YY47]
MRQFYHLKIAFRNLSREIKNSAFLLLSLCIGLVTFILVSGYVFYERGFDRVFPDNQQIYRVSTDIYSGNELSISIPQCERGVAATLKEKYPQVVAAGYLTRTNNPQYKIGDEIFTNTHVYHASAGFLDVFSIALIQGNKSEVLTRPYTAVISESTAKKYFGNANPVGQILFKYPVFEYTIEGVFKDIPAQAHFNAEVLLSFHDDMHLPPPAKAQWGETGFYTYLKLDKNADVSQIESGVNEIVAENKKLQFEKSNVKHIYHLQPLNEIHLYSEMKNELETNSRAEYVTLIFVIGLLILCASGFNYIQFAFSRLINSAKKTGIKKINGATRAEILWASLSESLIIHFLAVFISMSIGWMLVPVMQNQFGIMLRPVFVSPLFLATLFSIIAISLLIGGIVPALMINRFNGLDLLKLRYKPVSRGLSFRQVIVVAQFVIIIAIMAGVAGVSKQVNFLMDKDKGFDVKNTLVIKVPKNLRKTSQRINNLQAFEEELLSNSAILGFSSSNVVPGDLSAYNFNFTEKLTGKGGKAALIVADDNFIRNYNIPLLAGTNFLEKGASASNNSCIINRAGLQYLGFQNPEEAIGRAIKMEDESGMQKFEVTVIGVAENVDFSNAKESHKPMVLINWTENMIWGNYSVKLASADFASVIPFIKAKFSNTFPNYPFEYLIIEDYYNRQFDKEIQLVKIFRLFIVVAIFISVINLFSIAWLISLARVKEIGIRKVNGARITEILTMLNKDFVMWVAIAFVIATPIAWYAMSKWLENFACKTELSWWIFALAGLLALGIALLTVSWQSWRAATRNPVEALRYE